MSIGATNCLCPVDRGGQSETDLRARLRLGLLNQKLYAKRSAGAEKVTDAEVAAYFAYEARSSAHGCGLSPGRSHPRALSFQPYPAAVEVSARSAGQGAALPPDLSAQPPTSTATPTATKETPQ